MRVNLADEAPGTRYGKWTVIRHAGRNQDRNRRTLECKCECGEKRVVVKRDLVKGDSKSCGCLKRDKLKMRGRLLCVVALERHYASYKRYSSIERRRFDMSIDEFREITSLQCHYCAAAPKEHQVTRNAGRFDPAYKVMSGYFANGIDRVDSSVGYEKCNVVPCCSACNSAKSDMSYSDFLELCNRVAIVHPAKSEVDNG